VQESDRHMEAKKVKMKKTSRPKVLGRPGVLIVLNEFF